MELAKYKLSEKVIEINMSWYNNAWKKFINSRQNDEN